MNQSVRRKTNDDRHQIIVNFARFVDIFDITTKNKGNSSV